MNKNATLKYKDRLAVVKIVAVYVFFGSLWIFLSDSVVELFTSNPSVIIKIAMLKGFFFILFTSTLLYFLIARRVKQIIGSEKLLRRSEDRFKQIAENSGEIIWEIGIGGKFAYVNPVVKVILGYSPEEVIENKTIYDLLNLEKNPTLRLDLEQAFLNRNSLKSYVAVFSHKNGNDVILESNASPVISSKNELVGYRGASIDITERKKAEALLKESEEKYRTLIETSPDAILLLSIEGDIILANGAAAKMHGYSSKMELMSHSAREIIEQGELDKIYRNLEKAIVEGTHSNDEYIFVKKNGDRFYAELSLSLLYKEDGSPKGVIGIAKDISERKKIEKELADYRLHLENIVSERTRSLEELNHLLQKEILKQKEAEEKVIAALEKEKELNALKSEFISTASHEFRTPLATILSSTELSEKHWENRDKERFFVHTDRIKKAIKYLTGLMDDVLTVSRAEARKISFDPQPVDLENLCSVIVDEAKTLTNENNILDFHYRLAGKIYEIDEKLLKHILNNLLSNAIKFSGERGLVSFEAKDGDGTIIFEVSDNGIGIPEEDQKRIFDPFDRGSNIGAIRGTGLGMSIVKRSVELHRGTIKLESKTGEGSRFTVELPLNTNLN